MPEQNLKTVAAAFDPFRVTSLRAAQIGLVGADEGDEGKYRRISSRSVKDLTPMQYHDVCLKAFYLWQRNPLAKRLIEIPVDFCTGEDLQVKARIMKRSKDVDDVDTKRKDAQQSWNDFWEDPINHLEPDFPSIVTCNATTRTASSSASAAGRYAVESVTTTTSPLRLRRILTRLQLHDTRAADSCGLIRRS